jgi:hypothetical protein
MVPGDAHALLSNWYRTKGSSDVSFQESFPSARDPADSYKVVYEAVFEPRALDKARIEIWLTDEGNVAFGFETRQRLAARLSVAHWRRGFAAGHEPRPLERGGILAFLEAVSDGKLLLEARKLFGVLDGVRAVMSEGDREALQSAGYGHVDWIGIARDRTMPDMFSVFGTLVQFRPWDGELQRM